MRFRLFEVVLVPFVAGCTGASVPEAPPATYNPAEIARAALNDFDTSKNGLIEAAELNACPALKLALPAIDKNGDNSLSASEIQERVEQYAEAGTVDVTCEVKLDGETLSGATITFEPESCMGPSLKTATTTTNQDGVARTFQVDGKSFATLQPGLYRIKVTKDGTNIPARYNTQTTLGREVIADPRQGEATIELALISR